MSERVTEKPDGTTERVDEDTGAMVVERSGSRRPRGLLIALVIVIFAVAGGWFLLSQDRNPVQNVAGVQPAPGNAPPSGQ